MSILEMHETGTEAAATTAVVMLKGSPPNPKVTMTVNRPFLCAIRNDRIGQILFLGAIEKPAK